MRLYYARSDFKDADIVILGLPYDRTSSFIPGSRFGPQYIRQSSENIEEYSPYQDRSLNKIKICDMGDHYFATAEQVNEIERAVDKIYADKKTAILLGGEHTITYPVIKGIHKHIKDLSVIHFDAHCDLRDEYLGEKVCHATAIRRVSDIIGIGKIYQFGIRSGHEEEFKYNKNLFKYKTFEPLKKMINEVKGPLYISIDVDVLDPGVMPCVATPEPGGISYKELLDSLLLLRGRKIIGADVLEYNPMTAAPYPSGCTVAGLLREMILLMTDSR